MDCLPEIVIISSSTSSSLLFRRICEAGGGGILGKGSGPDMGLEASLSVSSELVASMSEYFFDAEGTIGCHCLSIRPGTGSRVTKIKVADFDITHQSN